MITELAQRLADLVRGIPGVIALYNATPLPIRLTLDVGDRLRGAGASASSEVSVVDGPEGLAITVSIGVADEVSALTVSREVYDAIVREFGGASPERAITVRVSSIG